MQLESNLLAESGIPLSAEGGSAHLQEGSFFCNKEGPQIKPSEFFLQRAERSLPLVRHESLHEGGSLSPTDPEFFIQDGGSSTKDSLQEQYRFCPEKEDMESAPTLGGGIIPLSRRIILDCMFLCKEESQRRKLEVLRRISGSYQNSNPLKGFLREEPKSFW